MCALDVWEGGRVVDLRAPDYSRAEKSYRAASIQRDHLTAYVLAALGEMDELEREWLRPLPPDVKVGLSKVRRELQGGLDAAEGVR